MLMPVLTPHGVLTLRRGEEAPTLDPAQGAKLEQAFRRGPGHGLLALGADEVATALPAVLSYWRDFGARYVTALCALPDLGEGNAKPPVPLPGEDELAETAAAVPPMTGAEYLTAATLADLWRATDTAFDAELAHAALSVQQFLKSRNPAWNLVGRVHFNLAENRKDEEAPFAFLATYTTRLSAAAKAQHMPLGKALQEYAGANNRERLLSLLMPVQRAAELCGWLKAMVDAGEIFHPLRWSPQQALQFLKDAPAARKRGRGGAHAGELADEPARASPGQGDGRRQGALGARPRCTARLHDGGDARRRKAVGGRDQAAARPFRRPGIDPRQVGRGRPRPAQPDAGAIRGDRAPRRHRWPVVRRGDAHAGGSGHRRG